MAKMAVYDKHCGEEDRAVFAYFRRDYIYRKNTWTRLCVFIGGGMLLGIYWLYQIFIAGIDLQTIDIQQSMLDSVLFLGAVLAFYTLVGTIQGTRQYHLAQKRVEHYITMLQKLDRMPESPEETTPRYTRQQRR